MASNRLGRTNDDIQFALSSILRNIKDPRVNQGLISITRVEATGDLRYAKVYISVLGLRDAKEFMKGLRSATGSPFPWNMRWNSPVPGIICS